MTPVSALALEVIFRRAQRVKVQLYAPLLNDAMLAYDITTPERQAAFLAQVGHESGELNYVREIYSGEKYDVGTLAARLGNTPEDDGDGEFYRGRGLIQITGRDNYAACSKALFGNESVLIANPELLEQPKYAALSAAWFWESHGCNEMADNGEFQKITRTINGGLNGWKHRADLWVVAQEVLV